MSDGSHYIKILIGASSRSWFALGCIGHLNNCPTFLPAKIPVLLEERAKFQKIIHSSYIISKNQRLKGKG